MSLNTISAQVGIGTTTPDDSAALDIDTDNAGFLMPRVSLTGTDDITTISGSEEEGLLVYNTVNAGSGLTEVFPGFYFWDGSEWVDDLSGAVVASSDPDWSTVGNFGTDDTVNYIGTSDEQDLVFSADGNEYMRLSWDTGFFGINTTAAQEYLDVNGDIDFGGGSTDWDSQGENLHIRARSDDWFVAATNASSQTDSSFYISTGQDPDDAQFRIENNGYVNIGKDNEFEARDMLHVTNDDENETTVIRIDNTNAANSIMHTALELWDGSTEDSGKKAFFRHNNKDNILEIGQTKDDGIVYLYSGDGSGSTSDITMTLDGTGQVGIGDDTTPNDMLHVTKDQNTTTTIRIDNTNTGGSSAHTSLELWDGSSGTGKMAYFAHNNNTDILELGSARGNGQVDFYSGDGSGSSSNSSALSMTLETDGHVTIQTILNVKPGTAPSSPTNGDIYYDSTSHKLRLYANGSWVDLN